MGNEERESEKRGNEKKMKNIFRLHPHEFLWDPPDRGTSR